MILLHRINELIKRMAQSANKIAALAIALMVLLTTADVVLRMFKMPIPGTYEIIGLLGSVVISFSLAYTSLEKGHIAVDFLVQKFSPKTRAIIDTINSFIAAVLFIILTWQSAAYAASLKASGEVSLTVQLPTYPFVYGIAIGCALLCLVLIREWVTSIAAIQNIDNEPQGEKAE